MIRFVNMAAGAALLTAVAGTAYAQAPGYATQPQPGYTTPPQTSYLPGQAQPPGAENNYNPEHFVKPPGYDQNPWMYPYQAGHSPKPS